MMMKYQNILAFCEHVKRSCRTKPLILNCPNGPIELGKGLINAHTSLGIKVFDGPDGTGNLVETRTIDDKVVTTAFVNYLVDVFQGSTGPRDLVDDFKYHESGESTQAEAVGDTACISLCGTLDWAAGTQIEGSSGHTYRSVATITYNTTYSVTEHAIHNSTGGTTGDVIMDRTLFSVVNVKNGWSIEFTFDISLTAGG